MSMRQLKITKSITNRESACLDKYLNEISKLKLLCPEEEAALVKRAKQGDRTATEKLVKANLRFVVSVAKQYQNHGLLLSDLINEGNLGLLKAILHFDETRGFKFISYAVWWIRQGILQAIAEQSHLVRMPQNKIGLSGKISKAVKEFEQEFEREPTAEEVADILNVRASEVSYLYQRTMQHISLDMPLPDSEEYTLVDTIENLNAEKADLQLEFHESLKTEILLSFSVLTERQKDVLCYFFGIGFDDPLTLEDIARKFNLTRERVRQIKDKAISRLKNAQRSKLLKVYLG